MEIIMYHYWSQEEINFLMQNYPQYGAKYCTQKLNLTSSQVYVKANSLNILQTKEGRSFAANKIKACKPAELCNVNPNQFIKPTTKEAIYLLGFLWADGYIRKHLTKPQKSWISLEIQRSDFEKIEPTLDKTGKWTKFYRNRPNRRPQGAVVVCNKLLHTFLIDNNYSQKHLFPKIIDIIPKNLLYYWFRGYFDGDGCLYLIPPSYQRGQLLISSCYEQNWEFMVNKCKNLSIKYTMQKVTSKKSSSSRFCIANKEDIIKFCKYIYTDYDGIGLTRKYNKYMTLINQPQLQ